MSAGRKVNSLSQEWGTPEKYVQAVKEFFGGEIDLDPCSNQYSHRPSKSRIHAPQARRAEG